MRELFPLGSSTFLRPSSEAIVRFYLDRLGFTVPWRVEDETGRADVAQVDRQGCALISDHWPEKVGKVHTSGF